MGEVLEHLGAEVTWDGSAVTVDPTGAEGLETPYELVRKMRASIIVLGPLLVRHGAARVAMKAFDKVFPLNLSRTRLGWQLVAVAHTPPGAAPTS